MKKTIGRARRTQKVTRKDSPTAATAKTALWSAIDRACIARGEAQWTNGYRCGAHARIDEAEEARLYAKEMEQFKFCAVTEKFVTRSLAAYVRAVKR